MPVIATITISVTDAGQVQVEGAIENKMLAYGLLEVAKESVSKFHAEKERLIQPATAAERLAALGPQGIVGR